MEKRINKHVYTWVGTFLFGIIGVDRFMRGQIGLGILKLITGGFFGLWLLVDWIIALTKLGKYEKDFVFIDNKYKDDKEAEEKAAALKKAEIEETNKRLKEAAERGAAPESVAGYQAIEKNEVLKNSELYPMVKKICMELLKKDYEVWNVESKHESRCEEATIQFHRESDKSRGYMNFYERVKWEKEDSLISYGKNTHIHQQRDREHEIWHFPFIHIWSDTPYTEAPPEWLMTCANVLKNYVKVTDPPFVQEYPEARKHINVMFR